MSDLPCNEEPSGSNQENVVKFLVGPDKTEFQIDKEKLTKFLHSMDLFNEDCYQVDTPVDSFRVFLSMINDGPVDITSSIMGLDLLRLARKLICFKLNDLCVEYLKANLDCGLAIAIYECAKANRIIELAAIYSKFIVKNFSCILATEDFFKLSVEQIAELYSSDNLNVTELNLVRALVSYAKRHSVDVTPALNMIRFQDVDVKQLLQMEDINRLFTEKQLLEMVLANCECSKPSLTRDGNHTIPIDCSMLSQYNTKGRMLQCSLNFSQDVFLEAISIRVPFQYLAELVFDINNTETPAKFSGSCVVVRKLIKKCDSVRLIFHIIDEITYLVPMGNATTTANGVRLIPGLLGSEYIFLIDRIMIKRTERTNLLDVHLKTEEVH